MLVFYSLQHSELQSREVAKKLEETVYQLEGQLFKVKQEMVQSQEAQKQDVDRER